MRRGDDWRDREREAQEAWEDGLLVTVAALAAWAIVGLLWARL